MTRFSFLRTLAVALTFFHCSNFAAAQTPPSVDAVIGPLEDEYGPFEQRGYLPGVNAYFGRSCSRASKANLLLVRMTASGPQTWAYTSGCPKTIGATDLDGDGVYEIVFTDSYAGAGFGKTAETYLGWPEGADEPRELLRYFTDVEEDVTHWYSRYGYEPEERDSLGYYANAYIPEGTVCDTVATCPVIETAYFCVGSCEMPVPSHMSGDPDFEAFVAAIEAEQGATLANEAPPQALSTIRLRPLEEIDSGEGPEWSAERQEQFENWLQEN